jgi:hypothetical protein
MTNNQNLDKPGLSDFQVFLKIYLSLLKTLLENDDKLKDGKYCSQLRLAERTFNFFLDQFPADKITEQFTLEGWTAIKKERDRLADHISSIIETDHQKMERHKIFCDQLKQLRAIGTSL